MSQPALVISKDFTDQFNDVVKRFRFDAVLVGIPQEDSKRDEDAPINNATLLAINNFGSPANNIPARPVMEIGIRNAQEQIAEQFKKCGQEVWKRGSEAIDVYFDRAGIIASSSIKKAINDQEDIDPPAESTIKARKRIGFKGTKALVVTGQMRNAITWIVRKGGV